MKKQEDIERAREEAEVARIAEEEKREQAAFDALPEDEKRKILKKQAKERALRKQKAMEDFEKHGIPLPEEFANAAASPKAKSSKKKTSKR